MKDLLIAIAILAVLTVLFSVYGTPSEQDTDHTDGNNTEGDSHTIIPSNEPTELVEHPRSPQTGGRRGWFRVA